MRFTLWSIVFMALGCREPSPSLEQAEPQRASSAGAKSEARTETLAPIADVPSSPHLEHAKLPTSSATPEGIAEREWRDIHWLPSSVLGITRYERESAFLIQWIEKNVQGVPECEAVLGGARRLLSVEVARDRGAQAQVIIGRIFRFAIEDCLRAASTGSDLSVKSEGAITVVEVGGIATTHIGWAELGDEAVAIYDDDRALVESWLAAESDALSTNAALLDVLRRVDVTRSIATASTQPYLEKQLGVPTRGMYFGMDAVGAATPTTELRIAGGVLLDATADSKAALRNARAFADAVAAKTKIVVELDTDTSATLAFRLTFTAEAFASAATNPTLLAELGLDLGGGLGTAVP